MLLFRRVTTESHKELENIAWFCKVLYGKTKSELGEKDIGKGIPTIVKSTVMCSVIAIIKKRNRRINHKITLKLTVFIR